MESKWPPYFSRSSQIEVIVIGAATSGLAFLSGDPSYRAGLFLLALLPPAWWITELLHSRRLRFEVAQSLAIHQEEATALPGGYAYLHLDERQQNLVCTLESGSYARLPMADITAIVRRQSGDVHRHEILTRSGDKLTLSFASPRDAEAWHWRLLHLLPNLGLETERLRAVDVLASPTKNSEFPWEQWGAPSGQRANLDSPFFRSVTPEFAEALIAAGAQSGLKFEVQPTGPAIAPPRFHVTATARPKSSHPRSEPVTIPAWLRTVMVSGLALGLLGNTVVILLAAGFANAQALAFTVFVGTFATPLIVSELRNQRLANAGLSPVHTMEFKAQSMLDNSVFCLIHPDQDHAYVCILDRTITVPISAVKSLHRTVQHRVTCLEVRHQESLFIPCSGPQEFEAIYSQWLLGLAGHRKYQGAPAPRLVTVLLMGGNLSAVGRMKLREQWLTLDAVPTGKEIPLGPLVGPVTPDYAARVMRVIHASGGIAKTIPYLATDPKPLCPPPGGPSVQALAALQAESPNNPAP